jgi:hypothetical protein
VLTLKVRDTRTEPGWDGRDGEPEEALQERGRRVGRRAGWSPRRRRVKISLPPLEFQSRRLSRSCAHDSALAGSECQSSVAETLVAGPPPLSRSTASRLLALLTTSVAASHSSSAVPLIRRTPSPANDGGSASPRQPRDEWRWWTYTRTKGGWWWPRLVDNSGCLPAAVGGRPQPQLLDDGGRRATSSRYELVLLLETKPTRMALVGNFRWN